MRNILKRTVLIGISCFLASCNGYVNPKQVALSPDKAFGVIGIKLLHDGSSPKGAGLSKHCQVFFEDKSGENIGIFNPNDPQPYAFIETKGEQNIHIKEVQCSENKGLYSKSRSKSLDFMKAKLEPGKVNYLGDITLDWSPDTFAVLDLVNAGSYENAGGKILIKSENNMQAAQQYFQSYPNLQGAEWVNKKWDNHPMIVQ